MIVNIVDFREDISDSSIMAFFAPAYLNTHGTSRYINDCHDYDKSKLEFDVISLVQALEHGRDLEGSFTLFIYNLEQVSFGE